MKIKLKEYIAEHREELENNPNVSNVGKTIQYASEFKIKAAEMKIQGYSNRDIFESNNLPYSNRTSRNYILKWVKQYNELGNESFYIETRGKNSNGKSGRPKKENITVDEKVMIQDKIIEALRMENEALKKLLWQGKKVKENLNKFMPTKRIFEFIDELRQRSDIPIVSLCKYFEVSKSGYYKWVKTLSKQQLREEQDISDFNLINEVWLKDKTFGYQRITMELYYEYGVIMNAKKVYRLMKKYGIRSTVRKKNPYKHLIDAYKEHYYFDNLLDRQFDVAKPGTVFATDITYLIFNNQRYYLSVVKDLCTREIAAWKVSRGLGVDLSVDVIDQLIEKYGNLNESLIHSDQGMHYTNPTYVNKLKLLRVNQSMSRRGNCIDNAKMETFFGHFKDECPYNEANNLNEVIKIVNTYMNYYNNKRYQWTLKKMAPVQYRNHLLAA